MKQHILIPTRQRADDEPHMLDLLITRDDIIANLQHMSPLGKSDHSNLNFERDVSAVTYSQPTTYNYQKDSCDKICI